MKANARNKLGKIFSVTDLKERVELEDELRKATLMKIFCSIAGLAFSGSVLILLLVGIFTGQSGAFIGAGSFCLVLGLIAVSFLFAQREQPRQSCWTLVTVYLLLIFFTYWLLGMLGVIFVFQFAALGAALTVLRSHEIIGIAAISLLTGLLTFVARVYLKLFAPLLTLDNALENLLNITLFFVGVPAAMLILAFPTRYQLLTISRRNFQLQDAFQQLQTRQAVSQAVSQEVLSLSTQLSSSALQWSDGTQQQVSTVSQVRTAVLQLSSTAGNIASLTEKVSASAAAVAQDSQQIEQTADISFTQTEVGQEAIHQNSQLSSEVARLYQQLMDSMGDLQKRGQNMRLILGLIREVTEETHLLSLNAAIEAAGAGEYGERFAVVAQEVKSLAKRSADATKQVVDIIVEVENATQRSVELAQSGYARAGDLETTSQRTSQAIMELRSVAEQVHQQAQLIRHSINEVRDLSYVIRDSTAQQRTASQQVLEALDGLTVISAQSAEGSHMITGSAAKLTELSENLKLSLTT